jgi:two-component system, NarL family, response regulator NreC
MSIRVLLADGQRIIRKALRALLEQAGFEVLGEAWDSRGAANMAGELRPEVAILDLPVASGVEAARSMQQLSPKTEQVLLTSETEEQRVLEALRAGIKGYVLKSQAATDLFQAIREVARGAIYLSPAVSRVVVQAWQDKVDLPRDPLTSRAREVLRLVAEGRTTKEIAQTLGLSVKTAESHRSRIMGRLGIHDTAGLVRYAIRRGLIQP